MDEIKKESSNKKRLKTKQIVIKRIRTESDIKENKLKY